MSEKNSLVTLSIPDLTPQDNPFCPDSKGRPAWFQQPVPEFGGESFLFMLPFVYNGLKYSTTIACSAM